MSSDVTAVHTELQELAAMVLDLKAQIADLRAALAAEVRTRRLVIVDTAGAERVDASIDADNDGAVLRVVGPELDEDGERAPQGEILLRADATSAELHLSSTADVERDAGRVCSASVAVEHGFFGVVRATGPGRDAEIALHAKQRIADVEVRRR